MDDQVYSGLNRLRALLGWWGLSGYEDHSRVAQEFMQLQNFVTEIQKAYLDATGRHMDAVFASNNRLVQSACHLSNDGKRSELSAAQAQIVSIVLEAAAQHARAWAEFQHQVQEIYSALARPPAENGENAPSPTTMQVKDKQRTGQQAGEKIVDAA
jgi:hypothetical protein